MNNKPVAWMDEINTFVLDKDYQQFPKSLQNGMIPLYTHPVKEAKYGITTKWDGITTYHETTEPIGKAQKNEQK